VGLKIETDYLFAALGLLGSALTLLAPSAGFALILGAVLVAMCGIRIDGLRIKATWNRPVTSMYWIAAGSALMFLGALAILWGISLSKRDPFDWRVSLPGHFNVNGALYIHSIHVEGMHYLGRPIDFSQATIRSNVTGQVIPLFLTVVNEAPIPPADANPIPPEANVELNAMLYDPATSSAASDNGMPIAQFIKDWSSFSLSVTLDGRDYDHVFDERWVKDQVAADGASVTSPPLVAMPPTEVPLTTVNDRPPEIFYQTGWSLQ
jgi:hypothetical protein